MGRLLQDLVSSLAKSFNLAVLNGLAQHENQDLKGPKISTVDTDELRGDVIANKGQFGFSDVTDPCWAGVSLIAALARLCNDPNDHVFWDQVHPTAAGHLLADEYALKALTAVTQQSAWR
jgi:phospholipase/lecithinase/hemolysin